MKKRFSGPQIVAKLRQADVLIGQGKNVPEVCKEIEITSQNHGFCVDMDSLKSKGLELTHINLNDKTVEGISSKGLNAFSVQYHPEASPGPHDAAYLFDEFTRLMDKS